MWPNVSELKTCVCVQMLVSEKNICTLRSFSKRSPAWIPWADSTTGCGLCSFIHTGQSISAPQVIHLCKEGSWQAQRNHLCRKSQTAGWAQSPRRRAAERWPWTPTGCWCRPGAGSRRGRRTPGRSSSSARCRCRGDLDHGGWSHADGREGREGRGGGGRGGHKNC